MSHTRVPTESRPGHVALIAGLYEDVSAVTTGWKLNPVNFDSVFNRSRHTWSWGSPDILPMFSTGAEEGRVEDYTYGHEFEDFSKDATELDFWVFDRVKQLFKDAETDPDLNARLRQDKLVFFLHLLGLDTTGHSYRPYSKEYLHNIKIVDAGVREITEIMDNFYGDDETAFVFTADHGMSDWGSHGDGHPDNTRTPLIAWGSGVSKPVTVPEGKAPGHEDGFSSDWHLDHIQRHDVAQADIATLMAYLAGLEYPVNSVGELPLPFVDSSDADKAKGMLVNARQILEMYRIKEEQKKDSEFKYKPYHGFATAEQTVDHRISLIEQHISEGNYDQAIKSSDELIQLALQGLRYLQTYDWLFLRALITTGYIGWIAFAFTTAIDTYMLGGSTDSSRTTTSTAAFASFLVVLYSFLFAQSSPPQYYAYAFFPVMFWEEVYAKRHALKEGKNRLFSSFEGSDAITFGFNLAMYIGILEVMVSQFLTHCFANILTIQSGSKLLSSRGLHSLLSTRSSMASLLRHRLRAQELGALRHLGIRVRCHEYIHPSASHEGRRLHSHSPGRLLDLNCRTRLCTAREEPARSNCPTKEWTSSQQGRWHLSYDHGRPSRSRRVVHASHAIQRHLSPSQTGSAFGHPSSGLDHSSRLSRGPFPPRPSAPRPLPPSTSSYLPRLRPSLRHPHHLLRGSLLLRHLHHPPQLGPPRGTARCESERYPHFL